MWPFKKDKKVEPVRMTIKEIVSEIPLEQRTVYRAEDTKYSSRIRSYPFVYDTELLEPAPWHGKYFFSCEALFEYTGNKGQAVACEALVLKDTAYILSNVAKVLIHKTDLKNG